MGRHLRRPLPLLALALPGLRCLLGRRGDGPSVRVLMAANEKPALNVTCSQGHPMVERVNAATGGRFLGCSRYPECRETREMPTYLKLIAAGHEQLPGFGER